MIEELRLLIDLQKNLERQEFLKYEFENPSVLKGLKEPYEEMMKEREKIENSIKEMENKQIELEREVNEKKEEIKALRQKLQGVRNQKEYSEVLNGIDNIQKIVSSKEDEILKLMEGLENEKKTLEEKKIKWQPLEEKYFEAKKKWEEIKKDWEGEISSLQIEEKVIKGKLKKGTLSLFEKIYQLRKGQAVVPVIDGSCSGCHILLRPQQLADVKSGSQIIQCDQCRRILFIE